MVVIDDNENENDDEHLQHSSRCLSPFEIPEFAMDDFFD